jgi:DNA-directed RNA polymerase specialized sigma24 family protein
LTPAGTPKARGRRSGVGHSTSAEATAAAFDAIYRALFVRLVRRATWRFGLSKEDASEVVQDAFLVALAKLDTSGDPLPWLCRTVDNIAVNWNRKASRRARLMAQWGAASEARELVEPEGGER